MRRTFVITLLMSAALAFVPGPALADSAFIDWDGLRNPILSVPDRMLKDQAVVYHGGWFYLFASTRFEDEAPSAENKKMCFYKTRDFKTWECFFDGGLDVSGGGRGANVGSPDVTWIGGRWVMTFQARVEKLNPWSLPSTRARHRREFVSESEDLMDWTTPRRVMPGWQRDMRHIDGALAYHQGRYYYGYKGRQQFYVTRSLGSSLDSGWERPRRASAGGAWAENFQFIKIGGKWRMIATARVPGVLKPDSYTGNHEPYIYEMEGDGSELDHWARWTGKRLLEVPAEDWNRVMHANSAYLCDWRGHDGYFYLFYAGANDGESFQGRGHGKIGVARSRDLAEWGLPGGGD